jgi:threonine aldolase
VLCGSHEYIARARKYRKMVGGGMRQAGIIAAAGVVALATMVERLAEDHANARILAEGLADLPALEVDLDSVVTNILIFRVKPEAMSADDLRARLWERGVRCGSIGDNKIRMVTHHGITTEDVRAAVRVAERVVPAPALR